MFLGWGNFSLQHTDPDYSAAYVTLETDAEEGHKGYGITFTLGKGTEVGELNILKVPECLNFTYIPDLTLFFSVFTAQSE